MTKKSVWGKDRVKVDDTDSASVASAGIAAAALPSSPPSDSDLEVVLLCEPGGAGIAAATASA
ncbi:hypothetical protein HK405_010275, partial [Cladochytrium tenue]